MSACAILFPVCTGLSASAGCSHDSLPRSQHSQVKFEDCSKPPLKKNQLWTRQDQKILVRHLALINPDAITIETIGHKVLIIWGDPSQRRFDAHIKGTALSGVPKSYWGRSWVCIDWLAHQLSGATDRLGLFPILLSKHRNAVYLASDRLALSEILPVAPSIDPYAAIELLAFGQVMEQGSIFANTCHLGAGVCFHIAADGVMEEISPQPLCLRKTGRASLDDAVDAFRASVHRCYGGKSSSVAVSLSGGLDSRLILAASIANGQRPAGISYGESGSSDLVIARQLARASGIGLFEGSMDNIDKWKAFQRVGRFGAGEVAIHHGHALMSEDLLEATRGMTLLTGTGAETYRAYYYDRGMPGLSLLGLKGLRDRFMPLANRYIREEFGRLLDPFITAFPDLASCLENRLSAVIGRYASDQLDSARFLDTVYLGERVRRMVVSGQQMLDQHYDRCHPFLDPDVVSTMSNLPVRYRIGSEFHHYAIARLQSNLAGITWDKTQRPLSTGLAWHERYPGLASRLGRKPSWGKRSIAMAPYKQWLEMQSSNGLKDLLSMTGLKAPSIKSGLDSLLESSAGLHVRGVSIALQFWLQNQLARSMEQAI